MKNIKYNKNMNYISNLHTHTTYCDGKNTIEENILYAIEKNYKLRILITFLFAI